MLSISHVQEAGYLGLLLRLVQNADAATEYSGLEFVVLMIWLTVYTYWRMWTHGGVH